MDLKRSQEIQKWDSTRRKGKKRFVLVFGVLAWGLPMFVFMTLILNRGEALHMSLLQLLGHAILWTAAGAGFGLLLWSMKEKWYQQLLASKKRE